MKDDRTSQHAVRAWPLGLVEACRVAALLLLLTAGARSAWPQSKAGQAAAQAPQAAAVSALAGLSYTQASWPSLLGAAPAAENLVVLCYELVYANSSAQPFILEPRDSIRNANPPVACTDLGKTNLTMAQMLVVAIDARGVSIGPLKILNINLATQQGTPINPTPIRPSFAPSVRQANPRERILYLTWPNRLAADVIPTLYINAIYTPPAPGSLRENRTFYPAGSIVTTEDTAGHYFLTPRGGVTGDTAPTWNRASPPTVTDSEVKWRLIGPALPAGLQAKQWAPAAGTFKVGDVVTSPTNLNYYIVVSSNGATGKVLPQFPLSPVAVTTEPVPVAQVPVKDQEMQWRANGHRCTDNPVPSTWSPSTEYAVDAKVCDHVDGWEYTAAKTGRSGSSSPFEQRPQYPVTWVDLGIVPPTATTLGQQPPDQTVNLLTLQLPQTHALSVFNLAAGVVYSSVHSRTYGVPSGSTGSLTTDDQVPTSNVPTVEPVLFLTFYPWPVDAESRCGWRCLCMTPPGISAGVSLASPSSSFYLGASFEIFRNVQVVAGWNWAKEASLPSPALNISNSATSAVTEQRFDSGFFFGLTFNVSGFVQSIIGAGSSKSSSGQ